MINSIYKVANNLKDKVNNMTEYQKVLKECTSNENWNISNSKLQVLADHSYNWNDYTVIMQHLWKKMNSKPKEWRRIFKALHAMEYLIKNGAPRCIQEIKDDLFKIRALQDFSYSENGTDRGQGVRDKSRSLCELLSDPAKLQQEREYAKQTRDKFSGISSTSSDGTQGTTGSKSNFNPSTSAAPASGKFGGFGSEDLTKFGYNQPGQFGQAYDPYVKTSTATTGLDKPKKESVTEEAEKKKKKKKKKKSKKDQSDSSDDSSNSSDSSSSDSEEEKPKGKSKGLKEAPKATRTIDASAQQQQAATQQKQGGDMIDLLSIGSAPMTQSTQQTQPQGFNFIQQTQSQPQIQQQQQTQGASLLIDNSLFAQPNVQQTQPNSLFSNMNVNQQPFNNQFGLSQQQPQNQTQQLQNSFGFQQPQGGLQGFNTAPQINNFQPNPLTQNTSLFGSLNVNSSISQQQQQRSSLQGFNQPSNQFDPFASITSNTTQSQPGFNLHSQSQPQFGFQQNQQTQSNFNPGFGGIQQQNQQQQQQQPLLQQQQQPQNQGWQPKGKADVWTEGSGLFDLNNLKSGDKTLLEFKPTTNQKDDEKIWGGLSQPQTQVNQMSSFGNLNPIGQQFPQGNQSNLGGFGLQSQQKPGFNPNPMGLYNQPIQQQQQQPMFINQPLNYGAFVNPMHIPPQQQAPQTQANPLFGFQGQPQQNLGGMPLNTGFNSNAGFGLPQTQQSQYNQMNGNGAGGFGFMQSR